MNSKKTHTEKKILLYQLTHIVEALYPNKNTKNPYFEQFNEQLQGLELEEQLLYHKLLKCFTLLNKQSRINHNQHVLETSREDIINVLQFFKNDYQINAQKLYEFYDQLETHFNKQPFTKLEVQVKLRTNKRFVERAFGQLQSYGLLQCVFKKTAQQSKYQLQDKQKAVSPTYQEEDIFAAAFEQWEDFRGFEQF